MKQNIKIYQRLANVPSTNDLLIILGILATIVFLSILRSSFQLCAIKNKIKATYRSLR